jgi:Mg/Co/Ni transporter MgtE
VTLAADEVVTESLRVIRKALTRGDLVAADAEALRLTVAQTVDVLERLPAQQRAVLYRMLPKARPWRCSRIFRPSCRRI